VEHAGLTEVERLWELRTAGAITADEFDRLKAEILGNPSTSDAAGGALGAEPDPQIEAATDEAAETAEPMVSPGLIIFGVILLGVLIIGIAASLPSGTAATNSSAPMEENLVVANMSISDAQVSSGPSTSSDSKSSNTQSPESEVTTPTAEDGPAAILSLPSFDTAGYCSNISDTAGGSYEIEETCRNEEADALGKLQAQTIPARIMRYCSDIGDTAGGSYQIMATCVEQEEDAASRL